MRFQPVNRYIEVEIETADDSPESLGIVLPEDYAAPKERYASAVVKNWALDVRFADVLAVPGGTKVVVDTGMIEEIIVNKRKITLILDNYVLGIIK